MCTGQRPWGQAVRLWDVASRQPIAVLEGRIGFVFPGWSDGSQQGPVGLVFTGWCRTVGTRRCGCGMWPAANPSPSWKSAIRTVRLWGHRRHTPWVRSVSFSPDGQTVASSGRDARCGCGMCPGSPSWRGHTSWVSCGFVFTGWSDSQRRWGRRCGCGMCPAANPSPSWKAIRMGILSVSFSPDGQMVASSGEDAYGTVVGCVQRPTHRRLGRP